MKRIFLLTTLVCACAANANGDCTLALSPSSVSYEARTLNMLQVSGHGAALSFGERRVRLSVDCPRMQALEVRFDAPAASRDTYRFGPGELQLRVVSARLDGRMIEWSREPGGVRNASLLRPGDRLRPGLSATLTQGQQWQVEMIVEPIVKRQAVSITDLSQFQALGSFRLE